MRRLLQGDVGAGKTAVAALGGDGHRRVRGPGRDDGADGGPRFQHSYGLAPLLAEYGIKTALLTGNLRPAQRRQVVQGLTDGSIDVVFGTHALFSET